MPRPADLLPRVIEPGPALPSLQLPVLWRFRELVYFLAWRDVKVRYKQTALGVSWVILQPLITTVVFSLLFGGLLDVPSGRVPYPVFACAALVPWNYFAGSLGRASTSLSRAQWSISRSSQSAVATTVAVRGFPVSAATSPKKSTTSRRRISSARP